MGSQDTTKETLEAEAVEEVGEGALDVGEEAVGVEDVEEAAELLNVQVLGEDTTGGELGEKLAGERGDRVVTLDRETGGDTVDGRANGVSQTLDGTADGGANTGARAKEAVTLDREAGGETINGRANGVGETLDGTADGRANARAGAEEAVTLVLTLGELFQLRLHLLEL